MARKSNRSLWADAINNNRVGKSIEKTISQKQKFRGRVLGIDPSLRGTGLAVLEVRDGNPNPIYIASTTINNRRELTHTQCLGEIYRRTYEFAKSHFVNAVAIEESIYVQNTKIAVTLGASRGAVLAAISNLDLEVENFAPLRIKQATVGFGRASKIQVVKTLSKLLNSPELPSDEADAAAVALTYIYTF